jgi:hypothetical protein
MGLNPSNFMDTIQQATKRTSQYGVAQYEQKILRALTELYDYRVSDVRNKYNPEADDPLGEFKYVINNPELDVIFMSKLRNQLINQFIYRLDKTKAWEMFFKFHQEYKLQLLGVVFPMKGHSDWIIHNLGLMSVPGVGRIVVPSKQAELSDIIIEPLKFFIDGRKENRI